MNSKANKSKKTHVRSGDNVTVISGNSKGKTGKIVEVNRKTNRVVVEGINIVKKHVKPSAQNPQGEIREMAGSIHISNVQLIDPSSGKPSRVGRKLNDKGKLQRYAKSSGKFI